jgi:hypothetical protein
MPNFARSGHCGNPVYIASGYRANVLRIGDLFAAAACAGAVAAHIAARAAGR